MFQAAPLPMLHASQNTAASAPQARPTVVFVIFQTPNRANGGVRSVGYVVEGLENYRPVVVTQRESPLVEQWRSRGIKVHVWPVPSADPDASRWAQRAKRLPPAIDFNRKLLELLQQLEAPVVHCNDLPALWHAWGAARLAGSKVVLNIRDTTGVGGSKWQIGRALADRVVVLSDEMKAHMSRVLPAPPYLPSGSMAAIERIYSVVDFKRMRAPSPEKKADLRRSLGIAEGHFAVGVIAALMPRKRQLELIEALHAHRELLPESMVFFLIGDFRPARDVYAQQCKEAVGRLGLEERVIFTGYADDVQQWYAALDAVLNVSKEEGLARCMIEGISSGLPVVSFDVCSAKEILHRHQCGRVVPNGDFVGAFQELRRLEQDPALRKRLGTQGAQAARRLFRASSVVGEYASLYRRLSRSASARWPSLHRRTGP